jgi:DNA-binding beta-propeller fold protein YncE
MKDRIASTIQAETSVIVGTDPWRYRALDQWAQLPPGWNFPDVVAVATDSQGRVYVFNRSEHPVAIFRDDGTFVTSWGEGGFKRPHGITIAPDDTVWCVDDFDHCVRQFTPAGRLLRTLGIRGQPSDTGATSVDYRTIRRAGPPFHYPTNLALAPNGELYIADGYGNARVHRFSPEGKLLQSWGEPGAGPGQFHLPHGIAVDAEGTVYVADRENSRIQLFTPEGQYKTEWTDVARPTEVFIDMAGWVYVSEVGYRAGRWPGTGPAEPGDPGGRVSIFDRQGRLHARWGGGDHPLEAGDFFAPHDIWADRQGNLYVGEVVWSAGGRTGAVAPSCHTLQKFVRL